MKQNNEPWVSILIVLAIIFLPAIEIMAMWFYAEWDLKIKVLVTFVYLLLALVIPIYLIFRPNY